MSHCYVKTNLLAYIMDKSTNKCLMLMSMNELFTTNNTSNIFMTFLYEKLHKDFLLWRHNHAFSTSGLTWFVYYLANANKLYEENDNLIVIKVT